MTYRDTDTGRFCTLEEKAENTLSRTPATPLEWHVAEWLLSTADDGYSGDVEGVAKDLSYGGCQSGMVGHLIYYTDTCAFFDEHRADIEAMVSEYIGDLGYGGPAEMFGDKWSGSDPFAHDTCNQNLLAWFGFEETARALVQ
jgi:hypothetical protein